MAVDWPGVGIVATAILGAGGIGQIINARRPKGDRENALIDQYQELDEKRQVEIENLKKQHAADRVEWEVRFTKLEDRTRLIIQYNYDLLKWAATGATPPPPDPPVEMYL